MGDTIPTDPPVLDPVKYYKISIDQFSGPPWNDDCEDLYHGSFDCCTLGSDITGFGNDGGDCESHWSFCGRSDIPVSRITTMTGPFDSFALCEAS